METVKDSISSAAPNTAGVQLKRQTKATLHSQLVIPSNAQRHYQQFGFF